MTAQASGSKAAYTTSMALLDALHDAGVDYIFANFGSDHPGLVEALARARAHGHPVPEVVTCPNEMVAMSAAHGYAQVSGRAQAVFVHVECGTQALAGAVHNAAKGRVPVFVFAGMSPVTQAGERKAGRKEFIQWIQDVHDQRGIVRGYMRYDNEIRVGDNVKELVWRALQFAASEPKGPVYLMAGREVLEDDVPNVKFHSEHWRALAPRALAPEMVEEITAALAGAAAPLVVSSYLGRNPAAVPELVRLCERVGAGMLDSVPNDVNFPHDNPLYQGNQWNEPVQNAALAVADVVLAIDSDVPWIPAVSAPRAEARVFHIDVDPLKQQMPLWYIPAMRQCAAHAQTALKQLNTALDGMKLDAGALAKRRQAWRERHAARRAELGAREQRREILTPEYATAAIRRRLDDTCLIVNEGVTNFQTIYDHICPARAGMMFTSGGGSLGFHGGGAIGAKLAAPDKTVIALAGDGTYMFSVPSTVHWIARRYQTPFLTVVYNNGGWKAPKMSALSVHPDGYAARANTLDVSFEPQPDYAGIAAAAGGALAERVGTPQELEAALDRGFRAVRVEKRCAVIDLHLPRF